MKKVEFLVSGLGVGSDDQDKRTKKVNAVWSLSKGDNESKHFIIATLKNNLVIGQLR